MPVNRLGLFQNHVTDIPLAGVCAIKLREITTDGGRRFHGMLILFRTSAGDTHPLKQEMILLGGRETSGEFI